MTSPADHHAQCSQAVSESRVRSASGHSSFPLDAVLLMGPHPVPADRWGQGVSSRVQKWFYEKFGEYVEDFRFQPEESTVETEEPLSARRCPGTRRKGPWPGAALHLP